jgi:hypothetical protein
MPRYPLVLAVLFVAIVIGCQDNNAVSPLATQEFGSPALVKSSPVDRIIIPLSGQVTDPDPQYTVTEISGQVIAVFGNGGRLCDLSITIAAELWPVDYPEEFTHWTASFSCCDRVKLPADGGIISFCK